MALHTRTEEEYQELAAKEERLRLALSFVVYDLYLTPTVHKLSHGTQCAIVDALGEEAIAALSNGETIATWAKVRDTIDDPLLLRS